MKSDRNKINAAKGKTINVKKEIFCSSLNSIKSKIVLIKLEKNCSLLTTLFMVVSANAKLFNRTNNDENIMIGINNN